MAEALVQVFGAGHFLLSEANGFRSRAEINIAEGQNLIAGAVLSKIQDGSASAVAAAGNAGNGAMGAITVKAGAKEGRYVLTIVEPASDAGSFIVEDPDGQQVGNGDVAAAYDMGGLAFTLADGGNNFAAGDQIFIDVAAGTNTYTAYDATRTADAILWGAVDATDAAVAGVGIIRDAEVVKGELVWAEGVDAGEKTEAYADLLRLGIVCVNSTQS